MRLHECCELIVDCEHKTAPTQETGYPSIRTPNIGRGYFILENVNRVSEETYRGWTRRAVPQSGDLIMAREAPVGNVAMVPAGLSPCLGQRTLLLRPDRTKVDSRFLTYLLIGDEVQQQIHGLTNGATVPHLNMKDVRQFELPELPNLHQQRRISGVLSAYDDLIENNQRRIKILEEMARALYREWFVDFRVSGNDSTELQETRLGRIPRGWNVVELQSIAADAPYAINGGPFGSKLVSRDYVEKGVPVIRGSNLSIDGGFIADEFAFVSEAKSEELAANWARPGDIVVTQRGTLGQIGMIPGDSNYDRYVISQSQMKITVNSSKAKAEYLYHYLKAPESSARIKGMASSSGVPHINLAMLREFPIVLPPLPVQQRFAAFTGPSQSLIESLIKRVRNLRRTRDLLLPRLLSGQINLNGAEP